MTFAFDEQFTMFDVTPVENQFILEQLPGAKGDYVKVYLYGLMHCYHPREDVTPESMSRELGLPVEDILLLGAERPGAQNQRSSAGMAIYQFQTTKYEYHRRGGSGLRGIQPGTGDRF